MTRVQNESTFIEDKKNKLKLIYLQNLRIKSFLIKKYDQ